MEKLSDKAEKRIKKIYPDARAERDGAMFFIVTDLLKGEDRTLGGGFSRDGAWCSAGCSVPVKN